jgi:acyl-CoA thioesterase-2
MMAALSVRPAGTDNFLGSCHLGESGRAYGGQIVGQALLAASMTVPPDRAAHSVHVSFLRPANPGTNLGYAVDRLRDGRAFTVRRVSASQEGTLLCSCTCSFQAPEGGAERSRRMPRVDAPDVCPPYYQGHPAPPDGKEAHARALLDIRAGACSDPSRPGDSQQYVWIRALRALPDHQMWHHAALMYMSDLTLASTALLPATPDQAAPPHGESAGLQMASLDHVAWLHRPFRADEWLLFSQVSTTCYGARSLTHGEFFSTGGHLVASVTQEVLIRRR